MCCSNALQWCAFMFVGCIVLALLDEQKVSLYWCVLEFEAATYIFVSDGIYEVVTPPCMLSEYTTIDGDGGFTFMFVECMERCRGAGSGRTGSTFVLVCASI